MSEQVDVVVIGMGVAGEEVAGRLAAAGLSVAGWSPVWSAGSAPTGAVCRPR